MIYGLNRFHPDPYQPAGKGNNLLYGNIYIRKRRRPGGSLGRGDG
jgi:hypothetical protein